MESILLPTEIEFYIESMMEQEMENLGSRQWLEWHQRLQKLNQEALIEAAAVKEEYVKEMLVSLGKVHLLVHEAILINIWKYNVLPHMLKIEPHPESTMIAYSVLYQEAVCVSLLELVSYHTNCYETMEDSALDLLHYASGLASQLLSVKYLDMPRKETAKQELDRQRDNLVFEMGLKSLCIIRYICENKERLSLSVSSNIYSQLDIPSLFIEILYVKPWIRDGKEYSSGKWNDWDGEAVCNPEAQIWLTLRHLLLDEACSQYYPITESRRRELHRLQSFLTPIILDQLSPLLELKQWLSQMSVMEQQSSAPPPILLQNCLEIKERIIKQTTTKWKDIAEEQVMVIFNNEKEALVESARILNEAYNTDLLEKFDVKSTIACARCGKDSIKRCSRCKKSWYCSRNCQVMHWSQHKENCTQA